MGTEQSSEIFSRLAMLGKGGKGNSMGTNYTFKAKSIILFNRIILEYEFSKNLTVVTL